MGRARLWRKDTITISMELFGASVLFEKYDARHIPSTPLTCFGGVEGLVMGQEALPSFLTGGHPVIIQFAADAAQHEPHL